MDAFLSMHVRISLTFDRQQMVSTISRFVDTTVQCMKRVVLSDYFHIGFHIIQV